MFIKRLVLVSALIMGLLCQTALGEDSVAKERFTSNPRNVKGIGDPFVLPVADGYDLFATGGVIGFNVWTSPDLITFQKTKALRKLSWATGDYWAPEVFEWQGRYVMLYTARRSSDNSLRIGVAFSDSPEGEYVDPLDGPLFDFGHAAIDGTLFTDDEGQPYMIYSRDCSENVVDGRNESHLYGVALAEDLLSTIGEPVLLTTPDADWEIATGDWRWNEGPAVLRHDGKYYLFYSANFYADKDYSVGVAVAEQPLGPYVKQGEPLLAPVVKDGSVLVSGPGHNAFFTAGDELFTAYHTHTYPLAPSGNRQLCVDRVGFHDDGTAYISGPTLAPQLLPLSDLGLADHMRTAGLTGDDRLLIDGDACVAASSEGYVWHGKTITARWDTAVTADMLLITPQYGHAVSGSFSLNGGEPIAFSIGADQQPGETIIVSFDALKVGELVITFDDVADIGEVRLIGQGE